MIGAIIGAVIGGLIIGALARLILPGKQDISILMTIGIGIVASLIASLVVGLIGYHNKSGFAWVPFIVGIVFAAIIITIYGNMTGRKQVTR
ncbi:GlsB/YeaQ/YmgE family stress response membrane protein [Flexivirga sp.]|uniref:GlsB/YeaQ/YmgE family stress response membrane protein n=1 Tax=Flexivirga sp. TaxID=1962927 RepID=UPI003F7E8C97